MAEQEQVIAACGVCPAPEGQFIDTECLGDGLSQVTLLTVEDESGEDQTTLTYRVCQCSDTRVNEVFFAVCDQNETPTLDIFATRDANDPGLNPVFQNPDANNPLSTRAVKFNVSQELGGDAGDCVEVKLVYNGEFNEEDLVEAGVAIKAVGDKRPTGLLRGLFNCEQNGGNGCDGEFTTCAIFKLPSNVNTEDITLIEESTKLDFTDVSCCIVSEQAECRIVMCGHEVHSTPVEVNAVRLSGKLNYYFTFDAPTTFCELEPVDLTYSVQGSVCLNEVICKCVDELVCPESICELDFEVVVNAPEIIQLCNGEQLLQFELTIRFDCEDFKVLDAE